MFSFKRFYIVLTCILVQEQLKSTHSEANTKKDRRKVRGVSQLQTAVLPRHQEEEETNKLQTSTTRTNLRKALRLVQMI